MASCNRSTSRLFSTLLAFLSLTTCILSTLAASAQSDYGYHFVRTDESPADVIYDRVHDHFYVSVPYKNLVYVVSGTDRSVTKTITVQHPLRFGLSADASTLYVGSDSAEGFFTIDTASLSVSDFVRYTVPIGGLVTSTGEFTLPLSVAPLNNGKMLITAGTYFMLDTELLMYEPETNTATLRFPGDGSSGGIVRSSSDGTRAVVLGRNVFLYDTASDSFIASRTLEDAALDAIISPDGKKVLVNGHLLFDETLTQIADLHPSAPALTGYCGSAFSADGTKIYSSLASGGQKIEVYDVATLSRIGYIPASQPWTYKENTGLAVSDAGVIVYLTEAGFEEYDANARVSTPTTAFHIFDLPNLADPASGLQSSPAPTTLAGAGFDSVSFVKFGRSNASSVSVVNSNFLTVQPPQSSTPGAVDVVAAFSDGWSAYGPEGYTYGPRILFQDVNGGDVAGGTTVTLYGQGFFVGTSKPQITIGGAPVTDLQSVQAGTNYTLPMQSARVLTPPGTKGWADIKVTTPFGSYTVKNGFLYVTRRYVDNVLAIQIALDENRNHAYVSDAATGDVKSIDLGTNTVSTLIPAEDSPTSALALTPDSNRLLVISPDTMSLRVFDLNTNHVVNTIHFNFYNSRAGASARIIPIAVVATSRGTALVGTYSPDVYDTGYIYEVDLGTGNYNWVSGCNSFPVFASAQGGRRILISGSGRGSEGTFKFWAWDADYNGLVYDRGYTCRLPWIPIRLNSRPRL
jgi:WD40 repeat protein